MNVVAELDGSLDLQSKYIYTNGMLAGSIDADGELYQYFHDGLGSITMICDSTGEYQNLYVYDDFGNFRMMEEAGAVPNSYYYTGQELDESPSGLYNLRARYYAAGIGRFTQEDPIMHLSIHLDALFGVDPEAMFLFGMAQPQGLHGYGYVWNNPMNWIDPLGWEREPWWRRGDDICQWWIWEGVQPGPWGAPYSEWDPNSKYNWGNPMQYTEEAGGAWMWGERAAVYGTAILAVTTLGAGCLEMAGYLDTSTQANNILRILWKRGEHGWGWRLDKPHLHKPFIHPQFWRW
jgi:RHS repeat-associated protein